MTASSLHWSDPLNKGFELPNFFWNNRWAQLLSILLTQAEIQFNPKPETNAILEAT